MFPLAALADNSLDWTAEAELGYGYDSNVAIDDVDFSSSEGDQFTDIRLAGGFEYELHSGISMSMDLTLSEKRYDSVKDFDGRLGLLSLGLERQFGELSTGAHLRYVDYRLDGDEFLTMTQFSPFVGFFPSRRTYARVTWEYSNEKFRESGERDNDEHRISLLGYLFLNGLKRHLTLRVQYAQSDAEDLLFDLVSRDARITYHHEFDHGLQLRTGYRVQWRDYNEKRHPVVQGHRADRRERIELTLTWPMAEKFSLQAQAFSNDFGSNLESADYDQQVYQVSLIYKR